MGAFCVQDQSLSLVQMLMGEILFTKPWVQQSTKTTSYKRQVLGSPLDEPHVFFNLLFIQLHRKFKHSESRSLFNMQGCEISTRTLTRAQATLCYRGAFSFCAHFVICLTCVSPASHQRHTPSASLIKFTSLCGCHVSMITM